MRRRKIYIEAGSFYGKRTGVGRYDLMITEALMQRRQQDRFVLFNFARPGHRLDVDFAVPEHAQLQHIRWFPGRLFSLLMRNGIALPLELFGLGQADLLIFPNFIAWPSLLHKKRVSVVHDVAFAMFPEFIQSKNLAYLQKQLTRSLHRSDKVIAVSEATRQDLIQHFQVPAAKIAVAHNAVDHAVFSPQAVKRLPGVLKKFKLPKRYLLFVGSIDPRKNLVGLLKAYGRSYASHHLALVIVGGGNQWSWHDSDFQKQLKALAELPIYQTGFIDDPDMAALYAGAQAFVYPSFYEGFGIPCLEAMASGCPVICSNLSSFPEIVGDAAIQVDPHDNAAITAAIVKVSTDAALRKRLSTRGLKQAEKFNWERSAAQFNAALENLL